jgi:hypothetical protein
MILVDLYNLELSANNINNQNWSTPEEDRPKILDFFQQHAPNVVKYQTWKEIERELKKKKCVDSDEMNGTFGMYEQQFGAPWFETVNSRLFYSDYKLIRDVVDDYLNGRKLLKGAWAQLNGIGDAIKPNILISDNNTGKVFSIGNFQYEKVDLTRYTILKRQSVGEKWGLGVGWIVMNLYNEMIELLSGELKLQRCDANDCNKIFSPAPQGAKQRFCSEKCRHRTYMRNYRKKTSSP